MSVHRRTVCRPTGCKSRMPTCGSLCRTPADLVRFLAECTGQAPHRNPRIALQQNDRSRTSHICFRGFASRRDRSELGCGILARRTSSPRRSEDLNICINRSSVAMPTAGERSSDLSLVSSSFPVCCLVPLDMINLTKSDVESLPVDPSKFKSSSKRGRIVFGLDTSAIPRLLSYSFRSPKNALDRLPWGS